MRRLTRFEWALWDKGILHVAGVDEAGLSPLAGPVSAAAAIIFLGHWEMEKRRKETRDWLRKREQQVKHRMNTPSIVPESEPDVVTEPEKNDHHSHRPSRAIPS